MTLKLSRSLESISRAQLFQLLEISSMLSSTLDLNQLLRLVIDVATELTSTEVASILLIDEKTGKLHFAAATRHHLLANIRVPLDNSLAGWIVRHGEPLIVEDVQKDPRHFPPIDKKADFVTRDMLGVPLVTHNRVIGALEALNKRDGTPYTDQDLILMQALASQAAIAIENARLFQQFDLVAEIMHELKTPLQALLAASELLLREGLPERDQQRMLTLVNKESERMVEMTRAYLDFARLESGRAGLVRRRVNLLALVAEVVELNQPVGQQREVTVEASLPRRRVQMEADYDRLKQALMNLVSNAIKYNRPGGGVTVGLSENGESITIEVADTGPGISKEHLDHLFELFYRVPDGDGYTEGTGLGLTITRKIIEEHAGHIGVTSAVGEGTTFTIQLPRVRS